MLGMRDKNSLDGTTWEFMKKGWWAVHLVGIGGALLLGRALKKRS